MSRKSLAIVNITERSVWHQCNLAAKENMLECTLTCKQWWLHCTSQRGWWMPLSEHVYSVAVTFKMTEQVEQHTCFKFCIKLEHSSVGIFGWFRRPQLCATGDRQLHHDNTPAHASHLVQCFLVKNEITQWLSLLQPRFGALQRLAFPKTKITFERKEISVCQWDLGKYYGAAQGDSNEGFCRVFWTV